MSNEIIDNLSGDSLSQPQTTLPKDSSILTTGIVALPFSLGIVGIILSIITLVNASAAMAAYNSNPTKYLESSYKKVRSGKICAIVSLGLFGFGLILIMLLVAMGAFN